MNERVHPKKRSIKDKLLVIVFLQVLFLIGLAGSYYAVDVYGTEITLETAPIDPRDLFYGDYVILSYDISRLEPEEVSGDWKSARGTKVYAVMQPDDEGIYRLQQAYLGEKPEVHAGEIILEGIVEYGSSRTLWVKYGLERYYVPEGTGRELEKIREGMKVKVKVAPWGQAKVNKLILP